MPPMFFTALIGLLLNLVLPGVLPEPVKVWNKLDGAASYARLDSVNS